MMRRRLIPVVCLLMAMLSCPAWAAEQALSVGYGFALFSSNNGVGKIEEGDYRFIQAAYAYEHPLSPRWVVLVEPFVAYVSQPVNGADFGFNLGLKVYPFTENRSGLFFTFGTGVAYTSVSFVEQGTHLLGILQGSIGYRHGSFFIENRWRHYSNGNTASPNRSINANIIVVGMYF